MPLIHVPTSSIRPGWKFLEGRNCALTVFVFLVSSTMPGIYRYPSWINEHKHTHTNAESLWQPVEIWEGIRGPSNSRTSAWQKVCSSSHTISAPQKKFCLCLMKLVSNRCHLKWTQKQFGARHLSGGEKGFRAGVLQRKRQEFTQSAVGGDTAGTDRHKG